MSSDSELSFGWEQAEESDDTDVEENGRDVSIHNGDLNAVVIKKEPDSSPVSCNNARIDLNESIASSTISRVHNQTSNQSSNTKNGDLSSFLTQHPRLTDVSIASVDDIGDHDEVWLVQCPYAFNLSTLVGLPILKNEKKKIKIPNTKYECVNVDKNQSQLLNLIMPPNKKTDCCKFTSRKIMGKFVIREKMENKNEIAVEEETVTCVPFPTDLKKRHPLFGIDYKKLIKLPNSVKEKLSNPSPKKFKLRNDNSGGESRNEAVNEVRKHAKKRKLDKESDDNNIWESEKSIEKCLFASPSKKKIKYE